jgi:uncharacterized lipoprotein
MKAIAQFFLIFSVAVLAACSTNPSPEMTPMEIRSLQTREFETNKQIAFPSVITVFQDLGYSISQADIDTGFISAESASDSDEASKFWLGVSSVTQTKATAYVEEIGSFTKVRINFVTTTNKSYGWGQTDREDTPILNAESYQYAFERIENAIFVRSP